MDTSMGLSSIATLSLGLSMSMAGAGRAVMRSLGPGHQQALQQFFPILPSVIQAERVRMKGQGGGSARRKHRSTGVATGGDTSSAHDGSGRVSPAAVSMVYPMNGGGGGGGQEPTQSTSEDHVTKIADSDAKAIVVVNGGGVWMADGESNTPQSKTAD
jgi:hypothetical protein